MKAKILNQKGNQDGSMTVYFGEGLDEIEVVNLKKTGLPVELRLPSELSEYERGLAEGIEIGKRQRMDEFLAWAEQKGKKDKNEL